MTSPKIAVVDYHKGNLSSVVRGLARAGASAFATDVPREIATADGVVIPGVGSFCDAAVFMRDSGQGEAIVSAANACKPLLGICLGLQLLFDCGDEGLPSHVEFDAAPDEYGKELGIGTVFSARDKKWIRGLGLLLGTCEKLESGRLKVPHVGWDQVHLTKRGNVNPLLAGFTEGANVYFTHSYVVSSDCDITNVLARTHYVQSFPCVAGRDNIWGVQFHPEKSSAQGLMILDNFVNIVKEA